MGIPLVAMTGALTLATAFLAYHAMKLWTTTKEIATKERQLKLMPKLYLEPLEPMGRATAFRFNVKNIGFGSAINMEGYEIRNDGTRTNLTPHTQREHIIPGEVFHWDIPNSTVGQQKSIEIRYTDILSEQSHTYTTQITVI